MTPLDFYLPSRSFAHFLLVFSLRLKRTGKMHGRKKLKMKFQFFVSLETGSYQPSNDMMLRFYSYFKQATLGPCTQKKPPFWDVVGR